MQDDLVFRRFFEVLGWSRRKRGKFQEVFRRGKGAQRFRNFPKHRYFAKHRIPIRLIR